MPPLEADETEDESITAHEAANCDPSRPWHPFHLAERMPGIVGVEIAPELGRRSELVENDDGYVVRLGGALREGAMRWKCCHEIGEFRLKRRRPLPYVGPDKERVSNNLAAALIVTQPAMKNLYGVYGPDLPSLAQRIGTTQVITTLRVGEALGLPVALVGINHVLRRGAALGFGDAALFAAVRRGSSLGPAWRVVRLTDSPWCWAVLPAW